MVLQRGVTAGPTSLKFCKTNLRKPRFPAEMLISARPRFRHSMVLGKNPLTLIDFARPVHTNEFQLDAHFSHGGVHLVQGTLAPHESGLIGSPRLTIVVHNDKPFDMEWRLPGSDRLQSARIEYGAVHIDPGDHPFFQRWIVCPNIVGIALDRKLVDRVGHETFGRDGASLRPGVAVTDNFLADAAKMLSLELREQSAGGKLFAEHFGILIAVHMFRHYSDGAWHPAPARGGLGTQRLRLVIDYIEANLGDDLSIAMLARIADRSLHHFSEAFRQSTGTPPHRYIIIRRIERAKILLLSTDLPIAQIALAVGFASQSHFGATFRAMTGVTPLRFRLDRL